MIEISLEQLALCYNLFHNGGASSSGGGGKLVPTASEERAVSPIVSETHLKNVIN
jgi:hypothetical protein